MHKFTPLLNHIYTNDNLHYLYLGLFLSDTSDHLPSSSNLIFQKQTARSHMEML